MELGVLWRFKKKVASENAHAHFSIAFVANAIYKELERLLYKYNAGLRGSGKIYSLVAERVIRSVMA